MMLTGMRKGLQMYSVRYLNISTVSEPRVRYDLHCLSSWAKCFCLLCKYPNKSRRKL